MTRSVSGKSISSVKRKFNTNLFKNIVICKSIIMYLKNYETPKENQRYATPDQLTYKMLVWLFASLTAAFEFCYVPAYLTFTSFLSLVHTADDWV